MKCFLIPSKEKSKEPIKKKKKIFDKCWIKINKQSQDQVLTLTDRMNDELKYIPINLTPIPLGARGGV